MPPRRIPAPRTPSPSPPSSPEPARRLPPAPPAVPAEPARQPADPPGVRPPIDANPQLRTPAPRFEINGPTQGIYWTYPNAVYRHGRARRVFIIGFQGSEHNIALISVYGVRKRLMVARNQVFENITVWRETTGAAQESLVRMDGRGREAYLRAFREEEASNDARRLENAEIERDNGEVKFKFS